MMLAYGLPVRGCKSVACASYCCMKFYFFTPPKVRILFIVPPGIMIVPIIVPTGISPMSPLGFIKLFYCWLSFYRSLGCSKFCIS